MTPDSLLVCDSDITVETFKDVQVFQYLGNDSAKGKITYSEKHDAAGRVVAYRYDGHKENSATGFTDVITITSYNNKGLAQTSTSYYQESDHNIIKTFYYYSDTLLVQMEVYSYQYRLKPESDKGLGRPGGCIVTPFDYETKRTWRLDNLVHYDYNNGMRYTSYSTVNNSSQNGWEYTYDSAGRMLTKQSMDGNRLVYTEYYTYSGDTTRTHLVWDNPDWSGTDKVMIYDHQSGKLLEEWTTQGNNTWKKKYGYDNKGRIIRYVYYNSNGTPNLTHIYHYK